MVNFPTSCCSRATDHPLTQLLFHYQKDIRQRLKSLIAKYTENSICQVEVGNRNYASGINALMASHGEAEPENINLAGTDDDCHNSNLTEHNQSGLTSHAEPLPAGEKAVELSARERTKKHASEIQKNLHDVTQEVHRFLHKLLLMFAVAYEQLDGMMAQDLCYDGIEESFFTPIWGDLFTLFRSDFTMECYRGGGGGSD